MVIFVLNHLVILLSTTAAEVTIVDHFDVKNPFLYSNSKVSPDLGVNFPQKSLILAFFTSLCPIKSDLSCNTVWPQAFRFSKSRQSWHFSLTFVHSKGKRSSLRSQCWMRLFCDSQTLCSCLSVSYVYLKNSNIENWWNSNF